MFRCHFDQQRILPARHAQINLSQKFTVHQGTMQCPAGIVDLVALAQRIQIVALAGMQAARNSESIHHARAKLIQLATACKAKFGIQERNIKRGVVNNQLCSLDKGQEVVGDISKPWLVFEKLAGDAMHLHRTFFNIAVRVQVTVKMLSGQSAIDQFHSRDFNYPMALPWFKTGRLGIQNDLPQFLIQRLATP